MNCVQADALFIVMSYITKVRPMLALTSVCRRLHQQRHFDLPRVMEFVTIKAVLNRRPEAAAFVLAIFSTSPMQTARLIHFVVNIHIIYNDNLPGQYSVDILQGLCDIGTLTKDAGQ